MNAIKAGVLNESIKLLNRKKYQVLLVLACFLSIGIGFLGGFGKGLIGLSLTNTPLTVLSLATEFILPLVIAMVSADLFTAEQENGSIKAVITRPLSRSSILTSKVLAVVLYTFLVMLVCLVISLFYGLVFNGLDMSNLIEILLAYAVSIVPMLPIIMFAVAVSQLCKNSTSTVMLSVFGFIGFFAVSVIFPRLSAMLFTSYTGWYKLFIGAGMPIANIINILALLLAYALIFFAVSLWAFEKKEY